MSNVLLTAIIMLVAYVALTVALGQCHKLGITFGIAESIVVATLYGVVYIGVSGHLVRTAVLIIAINVVMIICRRGAREMWAAISALSAGAWLTLLVPLFTGTKGFTLGLDTKSINNDVALALAAITFLVARSVRRKTFGTAPAPKKAKKAKREKPETVSAVPPEKPAKEDGRRPEAWQVIVGVGAFAALAILIVWGVSEAMLFLPTP